MPLLARRRGQQLFLEVTHLLTVEKNSYAPYKWRLHRRGAGAKIRKDNPQNGRINGAARLVELNKRII